jgi:hypothetical protein
MKFTGWLDQLGAGFFGLLTAWYFVGMLLCIAQTAPVHKQFGYRWQNHAVWGLGIDRYWLGFVRESTKPQLFGWGSGEPFDKNADYIKRYHDHRSFGNPDPNLGIP